MELFCSVLFCSACNGIYFCSNDLFLTTLLVKFGADASNLCWCLMLKFALSFYVLPCTPGADSEFLFDLLRDSKLSALRFAAINPQIVLAGGWITWLALKLLFFFILSLCRHR